MERPLCDECLRYCWYEECGRSRCMQPMKPKSRIVEMLLVMLLIVALLLAASFVWERVQ